MPLSRDIRPPNRFELTRLEVDCSQLAADDEWPEDRKRRRIELFDDQSQSIVAENDSPDIPFDYSVNPYRGCQHGCSYCYARNTHEYLGWNAGDDFESRILVKRQAPELLREFLSRPAWRGEKSISFSGVTDCYQPIEKHFRLTRGCLAVALEHRQAVGIVTKNRLVTRDLDLLAPLAQLQLARVWLSVNSLDPDLVGTMEPGTTRPTGRLRAVRELADAGVPVGVMIGPVIPGLNDSEIPAVLDAARAAGAQAAGYILLRLPLTVLPVFAHWLEQSFPDRVERVLGRVRQTREGQLNISEFHERMKGSGPLAQQIQQMFRLFRDRAGLASRLPPYDFSRFVSRPADGVQMQLFANESAAPPIPARSAST